MEVWVFYEEDGCEVKIFATPCAAYSYAKEYLKACFSDRPEVILEAIECLNEGYKEDMDNFCICDMFFVQKQKIEE